jgi:hypothetical protein
MGFRDPLVVRREDNDARAKAAPPTPEGVTGEPHTPVGDLVAYPDNLLFISPFGKLTSTDRRFLLFCLFCHF